MLGMGLKMDEIKTLKEEKVLRTLSPCETLSTIISSEGSLDSLKSVIRKYQLIE